MKVFHVITVYRGLDQFWQGKKTKTEILELKSFFLIDMDVSDLNFELICYIQVYLEKLLLDRIIADFSYMCHIRLPFHSHF